MRQTKKADERRINAAYTSRCSGIAISVMDIPRVFNVGRAAIDKGATDAELGDAIFAFVQTIAAG